MKEIEDCCQDLYDISDKALRRLVKMDWMTQEQYEAANKIIINEEE